MKVKKLINCNETDQKILTCQLKRKYLLGKNLLVLHKVDLLLFFFKGPILGLFQCDQIGRFFKGLGGKFLKKIYDDFLG